MFCLVLLANRVYVIIKCAWIWVTFLCVVYISFLRTLTYYWDRLTVCASVFAVLD